MLDLLGKVVLSAGGRCLGLHYAPPIPSGLNGFARMRRKVPMAGSIVRVELILCHTVCARHVRFTTARSVAAPTMHVSRHKVSACSPGNQGRNRAVFGRKFRALKTVARDGA